MYNIATLLQPYFWFVFRQYTWYLSPAEISCKLLFLFQVHVKFIFQLLLLEMVAMIFFIFCFKGWESLLELRTWEHYPGFHWAGLFYMSPKKYGGHFLLDRQWALYLLHFPCHSIFHYFSFLNLYGFKVNKESVVVCQLWQNEKK